MHKSTSNIGGHDRGKKIGIRTRNLISYFFNLCSRIGLFARDITTARAQPTMAHGEYCLWKAARVLKRSVPLITQLHAGKRLTSSLVVQVLAMWLVGGLPVTRAAEPRSLTTAQQVLDLGVDAARRLFL